MKYTPTSVSVTNYCDNGLTATATTSARNNSSAIETLSNASKRTEQNGMDCYADIFIQGPAPYTIESGR